MPGEVLHYLDEHIHPLRAAVTELSALSEQPAIGAVDNSVAYLDSSESSQAVVKDPYWPKWNSPWWHTLLLDELGLATRIPVTFIDQYAEAIDKHYLHFFPFKEEEIPSGFDSTLNVACHCYLGSVYRVFYDTKLFDADLKLLDGRILSGKTAVARTIPSDSFDASPDRERALSWVRPWFVRYKMEQGGLNCDESNYLRDHPSCSVLSTLPALEALLGLDTNLLSEEELLFLDQGVEYLLERKLFRSKRTDEVIDENWLMPAFPRFYFYDVLRGLTLVTKWALKRSRKIQRAAISEALEHVAAHATAAGFVPKHSHVKGLDTLIFIDNGHERGHPASSFTLLDAVDRPGEPSLALTQEYLGLLLRLKYMSDGRLLR